MAIRLKHVPGPKAKRVLDFYSRHAANTTFEYPLVIKDGSGAYVQDVDGNWFLDFNSQIVSLALGYKHPSITNVLKRYSKLGAHKMAGQDFYNEESAELIKNLLSIVPKRLRRVLLVNTGAEATENCMKVIWHKVGPQPGVSCNGAFHGRTIGALSHTHSKAAQKKNYPEIPHHIIKFCTSDKDEEIDQLEKIIALGGKPAFVVIEAIQGEGGYWPASRKFLQTISKVSRRNKIPLICDEVQSGLGRTGKWWGFEHYDIEPDLIASAKHLQVGAAIFPEEYNPKEKSAISTTWGGGHRIDMAVGSAVIQTIKKEKLLQNAAKIGNHIGARLGEMEKENFSKVIDTRGIGLMRAIEFLNAKTRDNVIHQCFKNGLCVLPCGESAIRIAPPLVIKENEADEGLNILESVIRNINGH